MPNFDDTMQGHVDTGVLKVWLPLNDEPESLGTNDVVAINNWGVGAGVNQARYVAKTNDSLLQQEPGTPKSLHGIGYKQDWSSDGWFTGNDADYVEYTAGGAVNLGGPDGWTAALFFKPVQNATGANHVGGIWGNVHMDGSGSTHVWDPAAISINHGTHQLGYGIAGVGDTWVETVVYDVWYFLALTYTNADDTARFWINGDLAHSQAVGSDIGWGPDILMSRERRDFGVTDYEGYGRGWYDEALFFGAPLDNWDFLGDGVFIGGQPIKIGAG